MNGHEQALAMALTLAETMSFAVFPCSISKAPAIPKHLGGHGHLDATKDPAVIAELWRKCPGPAPLIGVATGEISDIALLDIDAKHAAARTWWTEHRTRLLPTRTHRTRSGGLHLLYRNDPAVRCIEAHPVLGVDVKASGGYLVWWPAVGCPVLSEHDRVPWPPWLTPIIWPPKGPPKLTRICGVDRGDRWCEEQAERAIAGILRNMEHAPEGRRHRCLYWSARRLRERVERGQIQEAEAQRRLYEAAEAAGLDDPKEISRTIADAWKAQTVG
jgi:hypothetical protein